MDGVRTQIKVMRERVDRARRLALSFAEEDRARLLKYARDLEQEALKLEEQLKPPSG